MPTTIRTSSRTAAAVERLSWPDTAWFLILLARVRWLNRRLEAARRRVDRHGLDAAGPALVIIARRWLAVHETIAALLGVPESPDAEKVRATLRPLDEIRMRARSRSTLT